MRTLTEIEINRIKLLTEHSVEFALIEPTETGLKKSILDAIGPVRYYLKAKAIHDYQMQKKGQQYKILIQSFLITPKSVIKSSTSLYRPETKDGDPRIWFKNLKEIANANDIVGLIGFENKLYLINITKLDIEFLLNGPFENPFKDLVRSFKQTSNAVAEELLAILNKIASMGPIAASLNADTAIGRTLESLLGIDINSSKKPDYKGIELKSFRNKRGNRKTLFAQVPDWSISKFKSSAEILNNFGYQRGENLKLYCTVSAIVRNSQGLKLNIDNKQFQLLESSDKSGIGNFVSWSLETLHERLLEKHNETFWIAADSIYIDNKEHFLYKKVEHTKKPIISQFDLLLEQGIITLDHLIKKDINGKVVEKGPLFKIKPNSLGLLFPPSTKYDLNIK